MSEDASNADAITHVGCVRPSVCHQFSIRIQLGVRYEQDPWRIHEVAVSFLNDGHICRRTKYALMFETDVIVEYILDEGRNIEHVPGSGKQSLPNVRHRWYHYQKQCHESALHWTFSYAANEVCKSSGYQVDQLWRGANYYENADAKRFGGDANWIQSANYTNSGYAENGRMQWCLCQLSHLLWRFSWGSHIVRHRDCLTRISYGNDLPHIDRAVWKMGPRNCIGILHVNWQARRIQYHNYYPHSEQLFKARSHKQRHRETNR